MFRPCVWAIIRLCAIDVTPQYVYFNFYNFHDSCCKARSRPPPQKGTTRNVYSLKFSRQPDDGPHTRPKHVVAYYILLLIIYNCCVL